MLKKLQYPLPEVAAEWSQITDRHFSENDILKIAADALLPYVLKSQGIKLTNQQMLQHPALNLHFYSATQIAIKNENGQPDGAFMGRLFIDADHVAKIIKDGYVDVLVGYDTDTMQVFHFAKPVKVAKDDLVVTAENKALFEARYLGMHHD